LFLKNPAESERLRPLHFHRSLVVREGQKLAEAARLVAAYISHH
jgi:hypothetical protein